MTEKIFTVTLSIFLNENPYTNYSSLTADPVVVDITM